MTSKISWKTDERLQRILKENAKRREAERSKQNKGFDITLMVVFGAGFLLYMIAMLAIGIAWPIVLLAGGFLAGIIASFVV